MAFINTWYFLYKNSFAHLSYNLLFQISIFVSFNNIIICLTGSKCNLAKLGDGLDESPTVIVGEEKQKNISVKIGAY